MTIELRIPAVAANADALTLVRWLKAEGDSVRAGDVVAEVEAGRALIEIEATASGTLARILVAAGSALPDRRRPLALLEPQRAGFPEDADEIDFGSFGLTAAASGAGTMTVREALRDAIAEEMARDPSVFLIGQEVGEAGGPFRVSRGLIDRFGPGRVVDVPVLPQATAGLAVGAAMAGLRPILDISHFSLALQTLDQIVSSAAKARFRTGGRLSCPMVIRGPNGAAPGAGPQHAQDLSAWFAHIPGLKVVQPYDAADAKGLLKAAIRDPDPVVFLENETLYGEPFPAPEAGGAVEPLGVARIRRAGDAVTLVSAGAGLRHALAAAGRLAAEHGLEAEVIDLRTLRPLDTATVLASVRRTGRCVVVGEAAPVCSVAHHLAGLVMRAAFGELEAPVLAVSAADVPMPYAEPLERRALPSADDVLRAVRTVCHL